MTGSQRIVGSKTLFGPVLFPHNEHMSSSYLIWKSESSVLENGKVFHLSDVVPFWKNSASSGSKDQIWIDLVNPDENDFKILESEFGIEREILIDLNQNSPIPRMHSFKNYDFILLHRIFYHFESQSCEHRGVAIFRGDRFLITIHQSNLSRLFDYIENLAKGHPEAFLAKGNSRLFLHLLEGLVADYGPILNQWQEELEEIEESILRGSHVPVTERILRFKKLVITLRKALAPQRQILVQVYERLNLTESEESIRSFLKDVSEEVSNLLRELESLGNQAASVFEIYAANLTLDMSKSSHQMNVTMQRLSVMSAIFLPLTFIVGVYGMNIEGMPELHYPNFYYFLWGTMIAIVAVLLIIFKKMKWF